MLVDTLNSFSLKVNSGLRLNFLVTMVYKIYHTKFMFTSLQLRKTINANKKHHSLVQVAELAALAVNIFSACKGDQKGCSLGCCVGVTLLEEVSMTFTRLLIV